MGAKISHCLCVQRVQNFIWGEYSTKQGIKKWIYVVRHFCSSRITFECSALKTVLNPNLTLHNFSYAFRISHLKWQETVFSPHFVQPHKYTDEANFDPNNCTLVCRDILSSWSSKSWNHSLVLLSSTLHVTQSDWIRGKINYLSS